MNGNAYAPDARYVPCLWEGWKSVDWLTATRRVRGEGCLL